MNANDIALTLQQVDWFGLVVVPLLIFGARIVDVSIGTLRIVFIGRGMAAQAAVVGFVESLIWLLAVTQIMRHLTMPIYYIAFALGFGAGNYVGLAIERRLALGLVVVRLYAGQAVDDLLERLRSAGLGATVVPAQGLVGPVSIVDTVIPRRQLAETLELIRSAHPDTFYTVEGVAQVGQGVFRPGHMGRARWLGRMRK